MSKKRKPRWARKKQRLKHKLGKEKRRKVTKSSRVSLPGVDINAPPPDGIFNPDGSLRSGISKSKITESREYSSTTSGIRNKRISKRIARKCSSIHPHCSICGKCHTNRTTHDRGHI